MTIRYDEKFTGKLGTASRMREVDGEDKSEALAELEAHGCCAWSGKQRCGMKPTRYAEATGEEAAIMMFQLYASVFLPSKPMTGAWLCEKHQKDPLADIDQEIQKSQLMEYYKFVAPPFATGRPGMTPEQAFELWRGLVVVCHRYEEPIMLLSVWKGCEERRAAVLTQQFGRWINESELVIWKNDMWFASEKGHEEFAGANLNTQLVSRQLWIIESTWELDPQWLQYFELPDDAELAGVLLTPCTGTESGKAGMLFVILFQSQSSSYPIFRALPMLYWQTEIPRGFYTWLIARLYFQNLEIVSSNVTQLPRGYRRRAQKRNQFLPIIKTILLRKKLYPTHTQEEKHSVDWSCSWIVSGHWRKQWYPSLEENKLIYIEPYVKGPPELPLKSPSKSLYVVAR